MSQPNELPGPSGWEATNSALIAVDGILVVVAAIAQRMDLALLATSGLAIGCLNGVRLVNARYNRWMRERSGGMEN